MMIYLTVLVAWALGSALFVMALAVAMRDRKAPVPCRISNRPSQDPESILEHWQLGNAAPDDYFSQGRPGDSRIP